VKGHTEDMTPPWPLPVGLLIDMDGTLIDTEPVWFAAEQAAVARFGGHLPDDAREALLGTDAETLIAVLIERYGADTDHASLNQALGEEIGSRLGEAPALPGAAELVEAAAIAGLRCAVVSNSPAGVVEATLAPHRWARWLDVRITADDVRRPKPSPDLYRLGLTRLGLDASEVVAVEDSPLGATAAVAAGVRCIAVPAPQAARGAFGGVTPYVARDLYEAAVWLGLAAVVGAGDSAS
jgi:HAD superfamily hydrolase (TIGR01509 family)